MLLSLDFEELKRVLGILWLEINDSDGSDFCPELKDTLITIINSDTMTYRYAPITQLLAKSVYPALDCRCIQKNRSRITLGNFDARSVCHKVIIPWEAEIDRPLGGSKEPYTNNPFRVHEFSEALGSNQKNKKHWSLLVGLFQYIEDNPEISGPALRQVILEIKKARETQVVEYPSIPRISLFGGMKLVADFLAVKSGGERLQLICYALMLAMKDKFGLYDDVKTAKINAADTYDRKPADVVCYKSNEIVMAIEVKDTNLDTHMFESSVRNSRFSSVKELMFFVRNDHPFDISSFRTKIDSAFTSGVNVYIVNHEEFLASIFMLIGEEGRTVFASCVVEAMDVMNVSFNTKKDWANLLLAVGT